jgi:predicted DNA-binding ribbon-helix-helix protein
MLEAKKRSVAVNGRATSIVLPDGEWAKLKRLAHLRRITVPSLLSIIDGGRSEGQRLAPAVVNYLSQHERELAR